MSADDLKRVQQKLDANAIAIQRLQMQQQAQHARVAQPEYDEEFIPPQRQDQQQHQPQYQTADQNQILLEQIANNAAHKAAQTVQSNINAYSDAEGKVKKRMDRLVNDFPALSQEDSHLVVKARDVYARITAENPTLDEATKYELAVREAASSIGARPVNGPIEDFASQDYVMPAGVNPAVGNKRSTKSRLTPNIIHNAKIMGINVDPATPEGKKNLAELSDYSARYNADADETMYKYR